MAPAARPRAMNMPASTTVRNGSGRAHRPSRSRAIERVAMKKIQQEINSFEVNMCTGCAESPLLREDPRAHPWAGASPIQGGSKSKEVMYNGEEDSKEVREEGQGQEEEVTLSCVKDAGLGPSFGARPNFFSSVDDASEAGLRPYPVVPIAIRWGPSNTITASLQHPGKAALRPMQKYFGMFLP